MMLTAADWVRSEATAVCWQRGIIMNSRWWCEGKWQWSKKGIERTLSLTAHNNTRQSKGRHNQ